MDENLSILLVDDDAVDRRAVRRALKHARLATMIEEANDSTSALAALAHARFDCLLLDYRLPDMDGLELLRAIRGHGITTPTVMLTGQGDERLAVELMKSGASDYLTKDGMTPEALAQTIRNAIRIQRAEDQATQAGLALRESEARFRVMANSAAVLLWMAEGDGQRSFFNQSWLRFTGRTLEQEIGAGWMASIHPHDLGRYLEQYGAALSAIQPFEIEYRLRRADSQFRWIVDTGTPRLTLDGRFVGYIGSCVDITERKRGEDRQRFLAEASQALASSLDMPTILSKLTRLTVPALADWCTVDLVTEDGAIERAETAMRDGFAPALAAQLARHMPIGRDTPVGPPAVIYSGRPAVSPPIPEVQPFAVPEIDAPISSALCVPLMVRGQALGAMTLVSTQPEYHYQADDIALIHELGQRAAVAIDNSRLYKEARDAIRLRDAFLSVASHELKTPLTSLFGNAQLLLRRALHEGSLSGRNMQTLRVIVDQAGRLNRMIAALLDISRLQSGQFTIERKLFDLGALVQRLVEELRPTLDQHTITLQQAPERLLIEGDELRLEQVIQNLMQNAIKYSPHGGRVLVRVEQQGSWADVSISDEGIGIPEEALPHLFHRFYRASNVQDQQISGIGLGLYVVNEIVALHSGLVEVTSVEGQGSTFLIKLPLQIEAAVPTEEAGRN